MPIRDRISPFNPRPCGPGCYGVLVPLSQRYPPVAGRLHTRYAPVRRSPAVYCYTPLPLDLHVLGLPLAFILSQDQTLHCKNCFVTLDSSRVPPAGRAGGLSTHAISLVPFLSNYSRLPSCSGTPSGRLPLSKAGAKIRTFSNPPKFFFTFSPRFNSTSCSTAVKKSNFFSQRPKNAPQNGHAAPRFSQKSPPLDSKKT